jgi:hypothetical protein
MGIVAASSGTRSQVALGEGDSGSDDGRPPGLPADGSARPRDCGVPRSSQHGIDCTQLGRPIAQLNRQRYGNAGGRATLIAQLPMAWHSQVRFRGSEYWGMKALRYNIQGPSGITGRRMDTEHVFAYTPRNRCLL